MDFALDEQQEQVRELAARIFGDLADHQRQRKLETADSDDELGSDRFDPKLWSALADAGLLGLAVPEEHGGAGLGLVEACVVLEEAGRAAAPVPVAAATVWGALPLSRFGSEKLRSAWLERAAAGDTVLSAAWSEIGDAAHPVVSAAKGAGGTWRLTGTLANVPAGMRADAVLVPASDGTGNGLFLVELAEDASGVRRRRQEATDGGVEALLELDGYEVGAEAVLVAPGPAGDAALRWCTERATAALCVEIAGACKAALDLTARYTAERVQFGKPIATFQAVGQRAADAYIDAEAVRLTAWQAAWRLANDLPATAEVAVAKFWADDGAQRVVHAAQHLHGGVGVDRDYPVHRYYLLVKHLAPMLGGSTASLLRLGEVLAGEPASAPPSVPV
jgi:alkylation response protein AidB-like acyl-CoA dehydrogenase